MSEGTSATLAITTALIQVYEEIMLWLIESAKNILGLRGPRDGLADGEGRWEGSTHSKFYREYLPDVNKRYSCVHCQAHLAFHNDIISKVREFVLYCTVLYCIVVEGVPDMLI